MFGCVRLPHTDQNISVTKDEQQNVLLGDFVEVCTFLVGKEQIWLPEAFKHFRIDRERFRLEVLRKSEPGVVPSLTQEDVHPVILFDGHKIST